LLLYKNVLHYSYECGVSKTVTNEYMTKQKLGHDSNEYAKL